MASMQLPPYSDSLLKFSLKSMKVSNKAPKVSLSGKTCLITGANSGIGLACAKILPTLGIRHLIMAVRSIEKGEKAAEPLRQAHPHVKIDVWTLDMLSYSSIEAFAKRCEELPRLDIAILNAGVGGSFESRINPSTGHEETIQVNYLSTALLSILLVPTLSKTTDEPGRLTIIGSGSALLATFDNHTADPLLPSFNTPFSGFAAAGERYGTSKVLVDMFVHMLSQHVSSNRVIVNTVEPGLTSGTELHRDFASSGKMLMGLAKKLGSRTPEQAAQTYVDAIGVHGKESHGGFIMFWQVCPMPKIMHTEEGRKCMDRLWKETMAELAFIKPETILRSVDKMRGLENTLS